MKNKDNKQRQSSDERDSVAGSWQLSQDEDKELERRQQVLQGLNELNQSDPGGARAIPDIVFHNISSSRQRQLAEEYPARDSQSASKGHLDYVGAIKEGLNDEEFATLENSFHDYINLPAELQQKWQSDLRASKPDSDEYKSRKEYGRAYTTWTAEGLCSLNKLAKEAQAAGHQHSKPKRQPTVEPKTNPDSKQQASSGWERVLSVRRELKQQDTDTKPHSGYQSQPSLEVNSQSKRKPKEKQSESPARGKKVEGSFGQAMYKALFEGNLSEARDREMSLDERQEKGIREHEELMRQILPTDRASLMLIGADVIVADRSLVHKGDFLYEFGVDKVRFDNEEEREHVEKVEQLNSFMKDVINLPPDVVEAIDYAIDETEPREENYRRSNYNDPDLCDYEQWMDDYAGWAKDVFALVKEQTSANGLAQNYEEGNDKKNELEEDRGGRNDRKEQAEQRLRLSRKLSALGQKEGYEGARLILALAQDSSSIESWEEIRRFGRDDRRDGLLDKLSADQVDSVANLLDGYNALPKSWKEWWVNENELLLDKDEYQLKGEYRDELIQDRMRLRYLGKLFKANKERLRSGDWTDTEFDWASVKKNIDWDNVRNRQGVIDRIDSLDSESKRTVELFLFEIGGVQRTEEGSGELRFVSTGSDISKTIDHLNNEGMDELDDLVSTVATLADNNPQRLKEITDESDKVSDRIVKLVAKFNETNPTPGANTGGARVDVANRAAEVMREACDMMKTNLHEAVKSIPSESIAKGDGEKNDIDDGSDGGDGGGDQEDERLRAIAKVPHHSEVGISKVVDRQDRQLARTQQERQLGTLDGRVRHDESYVFEQQPQLSVSVTPLEPLLHSLGESGGNRRVTNKLTSAESTLSIGEREILPEDLPKFREKMSKYVGEQVLNDKMRSELLKQAFIRPLGQERMAELQQQYGSEVNSAAEMIVKSIQDADGLNGKECYRLSGLLNDLDALPDSDVRRIIQSGIFKNGVANAKNRSGTEGEGSDFSTELRDLIHQKAERIRQTEDLRQEYQACDEDAKKVVNSLMQFCWNVTEEDGSPRSELAKVLSNDLKDSGLYDDAIHDYLLKKENINLLTNTEIEAYRKHLAIATSLSADSIKGLLDLDYRLGKSDNKITSLEARKIIEEYTDTRPKTPEERREYNSAKEEIYRTLIEGANRLLETEDLRREYQSASPDVRDAVGILVDRDKFNRYDESNSKDRGDILLNQLDSKPEGVISDALMSRDGINLLTEEEVASYRKHLAMVKELSADSINELLDFDDDLEDLKDGAVPPDVRKVLEKYQGDEVPKGLKECQAYNQAQAKLYQMEIDKVNELAKADREKANELARAELEEFLAPRRKLTDQIFNRNVYEGAMSLLYTELMMKSFSKERYEEVIETFRNVRNGKRTDFGDFIQCRNASEPGVPDPRGMTQEEFERLAELTPLVLGLSKSQVKQLLESEEKEKTRLSKGDPNDPELWQKRQQYSAALEQRIRRMVRDNDAENVNMASVDRSRIVEMKAYIDAKRKLDKELTPKPEDLNAKGKLKLGARVRGAVARLWKGKIFRDYYEFKYQRELKEQYSKDFAHTLGANSGDGSASSAETEQALIWRMTQDSDFFTDTVGEKREQLSPDSEAYQAMRRAVETFVENGNEEAFIEETRRINNDLMGNEGMPVLDNYLTSAIYIKGQVDHGRALNDVVRGFKMYRGTSAEGVNSGHHERAIDKLVAKFERKKADSKLSWIPPEVVAGAAGLAGWATGAIMRNRVAQAASFGGSAIVAGILAGVRENEQVKIDRADLARRIAEGGKIDENNKYEVGLAETLPEMRTAESYMEAMDQAITSGDADQMRQVLADLVVAREVGRNEGIDLIDYYSGGGDAEAVRNELTSRQFALEQAYIRANEDPNLELGRYKDQLMDGLSVATRAYSGVIQNVNGALLSQGDVPEDVRERINEIYEVQANRDRVADKLRHRRVAKEVATTTARTLAFSTIAQEGLAFIRDDVHGAVEDMLVGQHGDAPNAARTALGNLLNTPNGGAIGEVVAGGNQPEKQFYRSDEVSREQLNEWRAKGFRVDERIEHMPYEHQVTVSAEDAVKGNPTFHRAGWLDYGTERPDYNELLGHHGEGSSYIFNPRGGSYGYGMSMSREDIIQAAREGHIKLMVSPTRGTQGNPFSVGNVIVEDNGLINFNPDAITQPAAADMIENRSYALLEVVDTKTGMVLATEVGSGTADSFTRTAKEMVDALTGYDITPPVDQVINSVPAMPDVEPLPPVPGYRGTRRLSTDDELFERSAMVETTPEEEVNPPTPTSPSGSLSGSSSSSSSSSSLPSSSSSGSSSFLSNGQSNSNGSGGEQPESGSEAGTPGGSSSTLSASSPLSSSSLGDNGVVTALTAAVDNTGGKIGGSSEELSENSGAAIDSVANNGAEKKLLVKRRQGESPLSAVAKSNETSSNAILPSDGFGEAGLRRESESNAPNSREIMTPEEVRAGWFCAFPITPGSNYQLRPELVAQVERNVDDGVLRHKDESLDEIFDDDEVDKDYRIFRLMIPDANRIMYGDPEHSLFAKSKDGKTKLTRLGSNFLRIMEANVYNPLNRPSDIYREYDYDENLIKSPARIAFVYDHHRKWETYSCCSELEKELKHSHMKLDDMTDVKELFCPWNFKDHKGEEVRTISVTRKGKYAIEDYFDENIAKGEMGGNLNLAGFLDAYSRYSKDEAHVKRWNEKLKDEAQNIAFHRLSIESDLTYEIGPIVYGSSDNDGGIIDSVADKIKSLGKAIQFAQSPQAVIEDRARRFLGDAVELFTVSLREDPPGWGGRSWVGLKMNDAGERAYERYCSESITLSQRWLSQDEVISPFGFINGYNAGKYRDPTPATA